jgi:hypothetical protein
VKRLKFALVPAVLRLARSSTQFSEPIARRLNGMVSVQFIGIGIHGVGTARIREVRIILQNLRLLPQEDA